VLNRVAPGVRISTLVDDCLSPGSHILAESVFPASAARWFALARFLQRDLSAAILMTAAFSFKHGSQSMSDTKQISEVEAIRQILAEGGRLDYIDVVNAVHQRFRLNVTAADVEQVAHDLVKEKPPVKPRAQVTLDLSANVPDENKPASSKEHASTVSSPVPSTDQVTSDLGQALSFVKSVGGLAKAKRLMSELETILVGPD
jgi:hypothetical protein